MTGLLFRWSDADEDVILPVNRDRPRRLSSRVAALLVVWLLACAGVFLGALPAQADAGGLLTSDPDTRDEVDEAPKVLFCARTVLALSALYRSTLTVERARP